MPDRLVRALAVIAASLAATAIADENFRCGSRIVYYGMTPAQVAQYCGEPTTETIDLQRVRSPNNQVLGTTEVRRWTYQSYSAKRLLVFVDGKLQSIRRL
jgi:Protein of unknown function (DUF2845)